MNTQEQIQQAQTAGQFGGVSNTPYHKHNGADSPVIPVTNLGILAGAAKLVGGTVTITNPRIKASSVITATSNFSHSFAGLGSNSLAAICNSGNAVIFDGFSSDTVNYIIIINP